MAIEKTEEARPSLRTPDKVARDETMEAEVEADEEEDEEEVEGKRGRPREERSSLGWEEPAQLGVHAESPSRSSVETELLPQLELRAAERLGVKNWSESLSRVRSQRPSEG